MAGRRSATPRSAPGPTNRRCCSPPAATAQVRAAERAQVLCTLRPNICAHADWRCPATNWMCTAQLNSTHGLVRPATVGCSVIKTFAQLHASDLAFGTYLDTFSGVSPSLSIGVEWLQKGMQSNG